MDPCFVYIVHEDANACTGACADAYVGMKEEDCKLAKMDV